MTAQFTIRVATPADAAAVGALLEASYPALLAPDYRPSVLAMALPVITKANPRLLDSGSFYLAQSGGGLVIGCGGWTKEQPGTGAVAEGKAHLRHFATHPLWLRRGVGRALFARCEADAKAAGVRRFECHSSLTAVAFYRSLGFAVVNAIGLELAAEVRLPGMLMTRELT